MTSSPKKPSNKPTQYKSTKIQMSVIINDVQSKLSKLDRAKDIVKHIIETYGKSEGSAWKYIQKANERFAEMDKKDYTAERCKHQAFLLNRVRENLERASTSGNPDHITKYELVAYKWYKQLLKLFPNGLQPHSEEEGQLLQVMFNRVSPTKKPPLTIEVTNED